MSNVVQQQSARQPEDGITRPPCSVMADSQDIAAVFNRQFSERYLTCLCGGADEPLYLPADQERGLHQVFFRADYVASALHEAAHWCIAGAVRRRQVDYGYWYEPDGRNVAQQRRFEQLEARPQALEWLFSRAVGVPFKVSIDNLDSSDERDDFPFQLGVWQALQAYIRWGLPPRASAFRNALAAHFGGPAILIASDYTLKQIL